MEPETVTSQVVSELSILMVVDKERGLAKMSVSRAKVHPDLDVVKNFRLPRVTMVHVEPELDIRSGSASVEVPLVDDERLLITVATRPACSQTDS